MIIMGFEVKWISALYIISMALLCLHLIMQVSIFQTLGLRILLKPRLDASQLATVIVFVGFVSVPISLTGVVK